MTSRKDLLLKSLTCVGNNSPNIYSSLTNTPFYIYERNDGMLACYNNRCLWEWRAVFATLFLHDGYSKTVLTRNNKTKVTLFVKFDNGKNDLVETSFEASHVYRFKNKVYSFDKSNSPPHPKQTNIAYSMNANNY